MTIDVIRSQIYTTNLQMLSQQRGSKLAEACMSQSVSGSKAARVMSQLSSSNALTISTSATPAMNVDMSFNGRWVHYKKFGLGTVFDDRDLIQSNIAPQGAALMTHTAAMKRKQDEEFISAFFGTAKTGETGSGSTTFPSASQVSVSTGASAATGMNIAKMEAAMELFLANNVDVEFETPYMAIAPKQHTDLKALTQITSGDFSRKFIFDGKGMITNFNGFNIIVSTLLSTDSNSYRRCPVWVKSGMARGVWRDIYGVVRNRPDLQFSPDYVEVGLEVGFTRTEEVKCLEIKCAE